eukprot:3940733-Rhodomonas_salina.1
MDGGVDEGREGRRENRRGKGRVHTRVRGCAARSTGGVPAGVCTALAPALLSGTALPTHTHPIHSARSVPRIRTVPEPGTAHPTHTPRQLSTGHSLA